MCDALHDLLDNIFIRVGSNLNRQIVGIPMGTNCAPLVADLFCSVIREISCRLFLTIIKLVLLKLYYLKISSIVCVSFGIEAPYWTWTFP